MGIDSSVIKNFTVFEDIEINFSDGINVIVGENGTGKTHLLKLLYALCQSNTTKASFIGMEPMLSQSFFMAIDSYFFKTQYSDWMRDKEKSCKLSFSVDKQIFEFTFCLQDDNGLQVYKTEYKKPVNPSAFIPVKEMLTHAGIEKDYANRKLPLDATLIDILNAAGVSVQRHFPTAHKNILSKINDSIGGKVLLENNEYYLVRDNLKVNFSLESEGYKKFGSLYRLIETGAIDKGTILFWDEPEANINPKLIPGLVDILYDLEEIGVQIFITTHNYILAKYFEVKRRSKSALMFHSLHFQDNSITCESNENFRDLKENPITRAFDILLDEVFNKKLGD